MAFCSALCGFHQGGSIMYQPIFNASDRDHDVEGSRDSALDGLETFNRICEFMSPAGRDESVIFDFSGLSQISLVELQYLLAKLAAEPRFKDIEISIDGLKCGCLVQGP